MISRRWMVVSLVAVMLVNGWTVSMRAAVNSFETSLASNDFDPAAFAQWVDDSERTIAETDTTKRPNWVLWNGSSAPGHSGLAFGQSSTPGLRHLRVGFKRSIPVGSVFTLGDVRVSILNPSATYPGNLGDGAQWVSAQRLCERGRFGARMGRPQWTQAGWSRMDRRQLDWGAVSCPRRGNRVR